MKVLVAYSGSECSNLMLRSLRFAGLPRRADVLVMTISRHRHRHRETRKDNSTRFPAGYEAACALTKEASSRLATYFPMWTIGEIVVLGSPAEQLIEYARALRVDLITLGCLGHSTVDRILRRSISQRVVNGAGCSVRICRNAAEEPDTKPQLVVGYDGMPGSMAAIRSVAERAWPRETPVTLLTTVGFGFSPVAQLMIPEDYDRVREIQRPAEDVLRRAGLVVSPVVVEGDPKVAILEHAAETSTNSIFIGHNEHSSVYGILIGTVAAAVLPGAACPVEVVRY